MRAEVDDPARARQITDALASDSRVEAAEPEMTVTLPPLPSAATETGLETDQASTPGPNGTKPNDPRYDEQWNFGWSTPKGVGADARQGRGRCRD
jgi:hypothetical protein